MEFSLTSGRVRECHSHLWGSVCVRACMHACMHASVHVHVCVHVCERERLRHWREAQVRGGGVFWMPL